MIVSENPFEPALQKKKKKEKKAHSPTHFMEWQFLWKIKKKSRRKIEKFQREQNIFATMRRWHI